jgi:hypothetical protein
VRRKPETPWRVVFTVLRSVHLQRSHLCREFRRGWRDGVGHPNSEGGRRGGFILCFVLFIPVLVAYVTKHPNRRSFWWKCSLSLLFPIAFFYLLVTALYEPQTKKVDKSSTGEQSEFIGEQF